jgi:hypothetical protein
MFGLKGFFERRAERKKADEAQLASIVNEVAMNTALGKALTSNLPFSGYIGAYKVGHSPEEVEYLIDENFDMSTWMPIPYDTPTFSIVEKKDNRLLVVKRDFSSKEDAINWLIENIKLPYKLTISCTRVETSDDLALRST